MSMNLNAEILPEPPDYQRNSYRAMEYGDGLFETIRVFRNKIPFMHLHWERLSRGMQVLGMNIPANWSAMFFEKEILKTVSGNARVKIVVWRSPGGLFYPNDNTPQFQIRGSMLDSDRFTWHERGLSVSLSAQVRLPVDALSGLKTLGATRYVLAAMEAHAKAVDDVLILNERGHICEAGSSNLIWVKGMTVFAPAPTDGQVSGTFQKILFELLPRNGFKVIEKPFTFAELSEAEEVCLTNAIQGIRWVRFLEGKELTCNKIVTFNKLMDKYLNDVLA
ncbi:MAG: aminotransferase class IV [Saprospiraceae bacterium]